MREQVLLTLPHPPPPRLQGPHWPFAALVAGEEEPDQGRARMRKEAMWWAPEPWCDHSCQLHVTAPALTRGAPDAEGGGDTAAPAGGGTPQPPLGLTSPDQGAETRGRRRRNRTLPFLNDSRSGLAAWPLSPHAY